jgi:hypothetical protein
VVEHEPDDLGFDRIDDDSLLGAVAAFLDLLKGEAEWQPNGRQAPE